jgi:hypothetical protein
LHGFFLIVVQQRIKDGSNKRQHYGKIGSSAYPHAGYSSSFKMRNPDYSAMILQGS